MMARLKGFAAFWYQFFIGDDWTVAVGVVVALAITGLMNSVTPNAWWITPVAVVILLSASLYRAAGRVVRSQPDDH